MNVKDIATGIFSFLFPNTCMSCGNIIEEGRHFCTDCEALLLDISPESACPLCGLEKPDCDCARSVYYFTGAAACYYNEGAAKNAVYNYKLRQREHYAPYFARVMTENLDLKFGGIAFDYITCVPMTAESRLKRGFDQNYLLAKLIGKAKGIPVIRNVIGCRYIGIPQHLSGYKERFENVRGKYYVKKHIEAENVLLIDDIKTTGATLDACARELLFSGAKNVYCLTLLCGSLGS